MFAAAARPADAGTASGREAWALPGAAVLRLAAATLLANRCYFVGPRAERIGAEALLAPGDGGGAGGGARARARGAREARAAASPGGGEWPARWRRLSSACDARSARSGAPDDVFREGGSGRKSLATTFAATEGAGGAAGALGAGGGPAGASPAAVQREVPLPGSTGPPSAKSFLFSEETLRRLGGLELSRGRAFDAGGEQRPSAGAGGGGGGSVAREPLRLFFAKVGSEADAVARVLDVCPASPKDAAERQVFDKMVGCCLNLFRDVCLVACAVSETAFLSDPAAHDLGLQDVVLTRVRYKEFCAAVAEHGPESVFARSETVKRILAALDALENTFRTHFGGSGAARQLPSVEASLAQFRAAVGSAIESVDASDAQNGPARSPPDRLVTETVWELSTREFRILYFFADTDVYDKVMVWDGKGGWPTSARKLLDAALGPDKKGRSVPGVGLPTKICLDKNGKVVFLAFFADDCVIRETTEDLQTDIFD